MPTNQDILNQEFDQSAELQKLIQDIDQNGITLKVDGREAPPKPLQPIPEPKEVRQDRINNGHKKALGQLNQRHDLTK